MLPIVRQTIATRLPPLRGVGVLAAVSGGSDSTALALTLAEAGARLEIAHVHHGIRGPGADADADFVRDLAARLHAPFHLLRADVPSLAAASPDSLEMAARRVRRAYLIQTALSRSLPLIATGHTADDQAETLLLRIARGTSPAGLAGIPPAAPDPRHPDLTWIRPLRLATRSALQNWLRRRRQPWRTDPTNAAPFARRNRVRHTLLPLLETLLNPRARNALLRLSDIAAAEDSLLTALAALPPDALSALPPPLRDLLSSHPALQRRRAAAALLADSVPPDYRRVSALAAPPPSAPPPAPPPPPAPIWQIGPNTLPTLPPLPPADSAPQTVWLDPSGNRILAALATGYTLSPDTLCLHLPALQNRTLSLRRPQPGDRLSPPSFPGSKKIADVFTDLKLPRPCRPLAVVATLDGHPVGLGGWRIDRTVAVPAPTAPALHLHYLPAGKE